jgi:cytoskeletal protein CcmA (bactofilin family)
MFSRKKGEFERGPTMPDISDATDSQKSSPPRPVGSFTAAAPKPATTTTTPMAMATQPTPLPTAPRPVEPAARRPGEGLVPPLTPTPKARETETRRLIVGREISLTGEITSCERLIVEGSVEANLNNCREVEIADVGLLKGTAAIEEAEIRGRFEGTLTVRKRLLIRATGKVSGTIRYGQLEVECGGQLTGDVQSQPSAEDESRHARPMAAAVNSDLKL